MKSQKLAKYLYQKHSYTEVWAMVKLLFTLRCQHTEAKYVCIHIPPPPHCVFTRRRDCLYAPSSLPQLLWLASNNRSGECINQIVTHRALWLLHLFISFVVIAVRFPYVCHIAPLDNDNYSSMAFPILGSTWRCCTWRLTGLISLS